jgi:hypothetical protein
LILISWGPEKYGHWIALFAAFALLQTLDLGHQNFIANELNVLYHKSKQELQKVLSSSLQVAWLIGFIELLITVSIIFSGNLSVLLGLDPTMFELSYSLLTLITMWFIFRLCKWNPHKAFSTSWKILRIAMDIFNCKIRTVSCITNYSIIER